MRKVIGIGETILDIIFRGGQPTAAVPGGSVFNGIISLGRIGVPICFISETGNDHVGNIILNFMRENNIPTDHVNVFPDGKSPVSLAFLNNRSDAEYIFYKDYPKQRLDVEYPQIQEDDIVIIGSYYALNPVLRDKVLELLERAHDMHAIIYYDPNFRSSHKRGGHQAGSHHHRESGIRQHCTRLAGGFLLYVGLAGGRQDIQGQSEVLLPQLPLHGRRGAGFIAYRHNFQRILHSSVGSGQHHRCGRQLQCRHHLRAAEVQCTLRGPRYHGRGHLGQNHPMRH